VSKIHRAAAVVITAAIFYLLFRRIPIARLLSALQRADYTVFFAAMIPNTLFYFFWDTLVLTVAVRWFHAPVRYFELLPARAASYVVGFFNTNAGRGTLALHLSRRLQSPFLQLGSTVLFLVLSEYLHLVAWATIGILQIRSEVARELLWGPPLVAAVWLAVFTYSRLAPASPAIDPGRPAGLAARILRVVLAPRGWALMRTFRLAPARRYVQIILLRAPMFFVSLCLHYVAARAFGLSLPFLALVAFLPVVFMIAALPITVARLGTTQAAWVFFFGAYADAPTLLAFSLAAHLTFAATRALLGVAFLPSAYAELTAARSPQALIRSPESRISNPRSAA
jgi:Lysylphosphatidylglycerol synthase TM region